MRTFFSHIIATGVAKTKIKMKARLGSKGKPFIESVSGDDLYRKTGKWNILNRIFNRDKDEYSETVTDPDTGEVIHECEEPLSQHRGHGSAGKRSKT